MATKPDSTDGTGFPGRAVSLSPIDIVDYDASWPSLYEEERARIQEAIGAWLVDIQHVGSTAVPGLAAKPIIDIAVALRSRADGERCIAPLEALGYEYCGDAGIPGRLYFHKPPGEGFRGRRSHHLHMYETSHPGWEKHILFRDYLRQQPAVAARYADLKRRVAAEHRTDVDAYTEGKTAFVQVVLGRARGGARAGKLPPIRIVDYDLRWPALFEKEKARILDAAGRWLVGIEHVGSTSVPGLAAKPVIDIMAGVARLDDAQHCTAPLQALGYDYVPEYEAEMPERRYFRKGRPRSHHIHMVEPNSEFWQRHIAFRDYLRAHPEAAREYAELKRRLAAEHSTDADGYTDAKTEFIQAIEAKARAKLNVRRGLQTPT